MSNNLEKFKAQINEIINSSSDPNGDIKELIVSINKEYSEVNEKISELLSFKDELHSKIKLLESTKEDMHLILEITKELSMYEKNLKNNKNLNEWNTCFNKGNEDSTTAMIGIYNKIYSASIVSIYNNQKKVFRVDAKLSLNEIFIKYAKIYNKLPNHINEICLISDGRVFFDIESAEEYISEIKIVFDKYFNEFMNGFYKSFTDSQGENYVAEQFIKYRNSYVSGINIIDEDFSYTINADVPF